MTQPYLSYRCWLLRAQAVSAAPAASFKSLFRTSVRSQVMRTKPIRHQPSLLGSLACRLQPLNYQNTMAGTELTKKCLRPTSESVQRGSVKAKRKFGKMRKGAGSYGDTSGDIPNNRGHISFVFS